MTKKSKDTHLVGRAVQCGASVLHAYVQRVLRMAMPKARLAGSDSCDVYPAKVVVELPPVERFVVHLDILHLAAIEYGCFRHGQ